MIKDVLDEENQNGNKAQSVDFNGEMVEIMQGMRGRPVKYDDLVARQLLGCVKVMSKDLLCINFKDDKKLN